MNRSPSRQALHNEIEALKAEIRSLRHGQHVKSGELWRYRENIIGDDWQKRYYQLYGGMLNCYLGKDNRKLRLALPLSPDAKVLLEEPPLAGGSGRSSSSNAPQVCFQVIVPVSNQDHVAEDEVESTFTLRLRAETHDEAVDWMKKILLACEVDPNPNDSPTKAAAKAASPPMVTGGGLRQRRRAKLSHVGKKAIPSASSATKERIVALAEGGKATEHGSSAKKLSVETVKAGPPSVKSSNTSASRTVHRVVRNSVLSSAEDGGVPEHNFRGVMNLTVIVAVATNFRLVVENFLKYGVLMDPRDIFRGAFSTESAWCLCGLMALPVIMAVAVAIELAATRSVVSDWTIAFLHMMNCILALALPIWIIQRVAFSMAVGIGLLMTSTIVFMKLVSYAHCNADLRAAARRPQSPRRTASGSAGSAGPRYPENVGFKDMALFACFPTLVYQTQYPRTKRIRKTWLMKRVGELLLCLSVIFIITEQFMVPTVRNARKPLQEMDLTRVVERLLKLAVPQVYLWLFIFYAFFHLGLNITAEITCFGDRLFYRDWWNATRLEDYWRLWNLPVHNWLVRHVYFPCLNNGMSKKFSSFMVFLVSALVHEMLVSIPCRTIKVWAFMGMLGQIPLIYLTNVLDKKLKGSQIGNVIFWLSFCFVGQPLCVLLYSMQFVDM